MPGRIPLPTDPLPLAGLLGPAQTPDAAPAPAAAPQAPAADELVKAFSPGGERIQVAASDVPRLIEAGGRLPTDEEQGAYVLEQQRAADAAELARAASARDLGALARYGGKHIVRDLGTLAGGAVAGGGTFGALGSLAGGDIGESFAQGGGDAATFGLGKLASKAATGLLAGDEAVEEAKARRAALSQAHGIAEGLGSIGGVATQSIATAGLGTTSVLGRAANVGTLAEEGTIRGLANFASKGAIQRALASSASMGVRGAIEGAIYGAANEATDEMFQDHDLAAQSILASAGHNALFGGLTGAGLGLGSSLARSGVAKLGEVSGSLLSKFRRAGDEAGIAAERAGESVGSKGAVASRLDTESAEAGYRALGGTRVNARKVTAKLGDSGVEDLGRFVNEEFLRPAVAEQGLVRGVMDSTPEALLPKIQEAKQAVGRQIGQALEESGQTVKLSDLLDDAHRLVQSAGKDVAGLKASRAVQRTMEDFGIAMENAGLLTGPMGEGIGALDAHVPLAELAKQRRSLATLAWESGASGSGTAKELLQKWERSIEQRISDGMDAAAKQVGGATGADYAALKRKYQLLSTAEDVATTGVERAKGNLRLGLIDTLGGVAGMSHGGLVGGLAVGAGTKAVRKYGDAAAAVLLQRAAESGSVASMVERVDRRIASAARGVTKPRPAGELAAARIAGDPRPKAAEIITRVMAAQHDAAAYKARVQASGSGLQNAPKTAAAYQAAASNAMQFMASKLPPQIRQPDPLRPDKTQPLSKQDAAKLLRYAEAIQDPMSVMDQIAHGRVTREGVEVLRDVYPKLYLQLQQQTIARVQDEMRRGHSMDYSTRVRIGVLVGAPTDPSLRPDSMRALQANVKPVSSSQSGTGPSGPPASPRRPLSVNVTTQQTALDRVE